MSYVRGINGYENSGDWTWEHWPPPFDKYAPTDSVAQPAPVLGLRGLGCSSCSGGCGDQMGLGQTSGGLFGSGLFASMNPSTWGVGEYVVGAIGVWAVGSAISDVGKAGSYVGKKGKRAARKAAKGATFAGISLSTAAIVAAAGFGAWWWYTNGGTTNGLGDYQAQGWATPQVLQSPGRSSQLAIPIGY